MRQLFILLFLALVLQPAQADEADVLHRLKKEPFTLFDWGLANLNRDIAHAAKRTLRPSFSSGVPQTGAIYDWRAKRINMYVSAVAPESERTAAICRATFQDIVAVLTESAPNGPGAAGWYLLNAFQPKGHFWASRFEDTGTKLLAVVRLEVSFMPASFEAIGGDTAQVRCAGRLDAKPSEIAVELTG